MKNIRIIKAGTTFPNTKKQLGDFDQWTIQALGLPESQLAIHCPLQEQLPDPDTCAGVIITSAHEMVTDQLPWIHRLETRLQALIQQQVPILGICFGHQLLAQAAGGRVDFHPRGKEIGTVSIHLTDEATRDPIFQTMPTDFPAHVTHAQTVTHLPPGAVCLAHNDHDPHQAFRLGQCAWGVQFHPEFSAEIMRAYILEQEAELKTVGKDISARLASISDTNISNRLLTRFGQWLNDNDPK
jgi:GMP synthase (glutamine-hydrolysing)